MSVQGSKHVPNDWTIRGDIDLEGQAQWYQAMFEACKQRDWVRGFALWSWSQKLYSPAQAAKQGNYEIFAKPAEKIINKYYR